MGASVTYGTAGATGGGWSAIPGALQPAYDERWHEPRWSWQARGPKTWKDRIGWHSKWSFGCRATGGGEIVGLDGAGAVGQSLSDADLFEPYSCDGEGAQSKNAIRGTTKDSVGAAVANAIVQGFVTATDVFVGEVTSGADGSYTLMTEQLKTTQHYLVAYKAGSPDIAGTTVNTLLATNVDGS